MVTSQAFSSETLTALVQETKTEEGRRRLLFLPLLPELLETTTCARGNANNQEDEEQELNKLRIFRNLLASGQESANLLLSHNVHLRCAAIISSSGSEQLHKVALQLLANLSNCGSSFTTILWNSLFESHLRKLARRGSEVAPEVIHMFLANLCKDNPDRACQLSHGAGLEILQPVLDQLRGDTVQIDVYLEILLATICAGAGCIPGLEISATPSSSPNTSEEQESTKASTFHVKDWQVNTLEVFNGALEIDSLHEILRNQETVVEKLAAQILAAIQALGKQSEGSTAFDTAFLRAGLKFWRAISSMDDSSYLTTDGCSVMDVFLCDSNLILTLLSMLAALGSVPSRRPDKVKPNSDTWKCPPQLESNFVTEQPYQGYRTDLLTVIANTCFRRRRAQDYVQQLGGIQLILENCQVDDTSPFLREAGLWCVRNLCEGNFEIQKQIDELKIIDVAESPELERSGLRVQHEAGTGKITLVKKD